jgi:hypothetical protein
MHEPLPTLLIVSRLTQPFRQASEVLANLARDLDPSCPESLVHGALVMAVAAVEVALSDSLKYYLENFPAKLSEEQLRKAAEALPTNMAEQIESSAMKRVVTLSYKSFPEFLEEYEKLISVNISGSAGEIVAEMQEIKATRNLLLHNGLKMNELYREQAGSNKRQASGLAGRLIVNHSYVVSAIAVASRLVDSVVATLLKKYGAYTKVAAHRRLWDYLFASPIMPYDDFWVVDEAADKIVALKTGTHESSLSSTELLFLGLWRAHFNGSGEYLARLSMKGFDRQHLRKFHFVLSVAPSFQWY